MLSLRQIKKKKKLVSEEDESEVSSSFKECEKLLSDYFIPDREKTDSIYSDDELEDRDEEITEYITSCVEESEDNSVIRYDMIADDCPVLSSSDTLNTVKVIDVVTKEIESNLKVSCINVDNKIITRTYNECADVASRDGAKEINYSDLLVRKCEDDDVKDNKYSNITFFPTVRELNFLNDREKVYELLTKNLTAENLNIYLNHTVLNKEDELKPFSEDELLCLYYNQELYDSEIYINDFVENELKSNQIVQQKLYILLTNYLISRDNLCRNMLTFESLTRDYLKFQDELWNLETASVTEFDECQDGNPVSATQYYKVARFSQCTFGNLSHVIDDLQNFTKEAYILSMFNVQLYKIKVESYVQNLCSYFSYLPHNAPINLHNDSVPRGPLGSDYYYIIAELRDAISVLFSFQRRPINDDEFLSETRTWLEKLLAVLLRIASSRDHLFILNHILRCPSGVGKWASCYIQPPVLSCGSAYNQQYLDHLITTLAVVLSPIKDRELFLQQIETGLEENGMWVIVDSDVEDSIDDSVASTALKEKDVISILDQIPFADIYRQILLVNRRQEQDIYDTNNVTDRDMLRAIAICSLLVSLLEKGITNYNASIYKQFSKRLSRLIKHTALYITDHWQLFRATYVQRGIMDHSVLLRLQTEYDAFLFRAAHCLYTTQNRIGWQYLTTLPFNMITSKTLWRLYQYLLKTSSDSSIINSEEFVDSIEHLPDNDIYYLLTTITNMALDRQHQDYLFVQTVTCQLFQVGFINTTIRDNCTKSCRILLTNLTCKYPSLISDIMQMLKKEFSLVGKLSLYLFKELPLSLWKPTQVDINIISDWILSCPLQSWESILGRYIITQLNWSTEANETELFLSRTIHCKIAMIIVRTVMLFSEEIVNSYGVPQGVSQIVRSVQTPEQVLNSWAWQVLLKLRIHLMDQPCNIVAASLTDNSLPEIPDIDSDSQDMQILSNGLSRCQSVACYVALLMTNVGHSVPLICDRGLQYCNTLLSTYKYSHVLHIIQLILPYILESVDSLIMLEKFRKVIVSLLSADRTYMMKISKNYITSEFPGTVLSQFASLIEYQLYNHSRYQFENANPVAHFWLRVLCSMWSEEYNSVVYLMNTILSIALFDTTMKSLAVEILNDLAKNMPNNNYTVPVGISSLFSWMSTSASKTLITPIPVTLLPQKLSRISHSPYFVYFALELEEYHTQTVTQLWENLLMELTFSTGKANIDNAVKKVCHSLKLSPISSSCLAIYRWSQFALDLPVENPLLPIFWQQFFRLYLQRVPGNSPRGSVGPKFFEGSVNSNYQNKLKSKLQQCLEYYNKKSPDNDTEKDWLNNLTMFYRTNLLWLEELSLHDPVLYLPSLPMQYNPQKLENLISEDATPWLEYVDFNEIRASQQDCLSRWNKVLHRSDVSLSHQLRHSTENIDIAKRIVDRLKSYDSSVLPPPLIIMHPIVSSVPREMLVNKNMMMDHLAEYFRVLTHHTQSYKIEWLDQSSACKKLLETLCQLYTEVQTEVKLYAACDTDNHRKKTVSTLICAGPAIIRVKIFEAKKDAAAEHKIEKFNKEYRRLLKHNVRNPPFRLIVACIILENTAETLQKEVIEVRKIGDNSLLSSLFDVGVSLFYKIAALYNTDVVSYFPTKQLVHRVIQILGEEFINNNEKECSRILSMSLQNKELSAVLLPHFTPSCVPSPVFIQLYGTVVLTITSSSPELILAILQKINDWLNYKKPRLNERSQFIEVLSTALKEIGMSAPENILPVHKLLRGHLCQLLLHEFPEHYGEILHIMLKYSEEEKFSCDIWFDVLNTLVISASCSGSYNTNDIPLKEGLTHLQIRDIARNYASEQRVLTFHELVETANILGSNFLKERLRYGLYGLYPKYSYYMDPLLALHNIIGHACIASMLQLQRGTLADRMCEQILPIILSLFSPWILPYFTAQLSKPTAPWIDQLIDDRSVLLPWVPEDIPIASKMFSSFTECIKFVFDALPASNVLLQLICQWYITNYAHQSVKEHILNIVHCNLLTLPWSRFQPGTSDLQLMLRVVDQYLPLCHSFLGSVFMEIPWHIVAYKDVASPLGIRSHVALLHLLIKLSNEPHLRQAGKINVLLMEAQHYSWNLVDAASYEPIINWFVANYDPRVVLQSTDEDWNVIDVAAFDLLQVAAGYVPGNSAYHVTTLQKRQMFVRACVRMILNLANRYKTVLASHQSHFISSLGRMLDKMESIMSASVPVENRVPECSVLLKELLILVNHSSGSVLTKHTVNALLNWLKHRAGTSIVLQGLLLVLGETVTDCQQFGIIFEACVSAWFKNSAGIEEYDWDKILSIIQPYNQSSYQLLEECLVNNSQILTLYTLTLKRLQTDSLKFSLTKAINWVINIKPSPDMESKLPLLWSLVFRECVNHKDEVIYCMIKFSTYLHQLMNLKQGWGLLGVIGLNKQAIPSPKCKLLSLATNAFILAKLLIEKDSLENIQISLEGVVLKNTDRTKIIMPTGSDCMRALVLFTSLLNDKHYAEYKVTIELATDLIKSNDISLYNGEQFVITLAKQLYTDGFIHAFPSDNFLSV